MTDQDQQSYDRVQKEDGEADKTRTHPAVAADRNNGIVFGSGCPVQHHHQNQNNARPNDIAFGSGGPVQHHAPHHHHHQQETSHHEHHDEDHSHDRHNPRELHTAESILEYMNDRRQEHSHNGEDAHHHHHRESDFKNYLEAQRHLKSKRRLSAAFFAGLRRASMTSDHNSNNNISVDEEDAIPEGHVGAGATRTNHHYNNNSKHRQESRNRRATMQAMSVLGGRQAGLDAAEFEAFLNETNQDSNKSGHLDSSDTNNDEDGSSDQQQPHGHSQSLSIPWYCRPVQRQRWDDDQVLPHINWGDLFFDLFYVAAAYNLGGLLISATNETDWPKGVLYFVGIFGGLYNAWEHDVVYSSRYTLVDYAHRVVAIMRFFCVAFAVLSIKSLGFLSNKQSVETFCLVLSLFCESIISLGLNVELYFYGDGDRKAIQNHTWIKIKHQFIPASITYATATIIAGVGFFETYGYESNIAAYGGGQASDHEYEVDHAYANDTYSNSTNYYDHADDDHHRILAEPETSGCSSDGHRLLAGGVEDGDDCGGEGGIQWTIGDVPILLCTGVYFINIVFTLFRKYTSVNRQGQDIREHFVPNNIDYMIHRYGEWIMLMIGESILSLLIVETIESKEYYTIAGLGCLTVIVLQMLKFESEPSTADGHALWRSTTAATLFSLLIQLLSMSLISFGVSYKIMLTTVYKAELAAELSALTEHRRLAGVPTISDEATARLFCISLLFVLLSLECMLATHKGVTQSYQLLFHEIESIDMKTMNWPLMMISILKVCIFSFTATMSLYATDPTQVTMFGFLVVVAMSLTRIVGWGFVHHGEDIKDAMTFLTSQTTGVGRNIVQVTHTMAKKTLEVTSKTLEGATFQSSSDNKLHSVKDDELAIDRALWETSFDAVIVTDRLGIMKYVNSATVQEFGYSSPEDLVGKNVSMLVGGGLAVHHHSYMDRFNKGESTSTTIGKQRKLQARRKNNSEFPVLIGIKEIPKTGLLVGYIRAEEGVSTQKNERAPIMSASERHVAVDESSFDSIIVIDPRGMILNVNLTTLTEFGYTSKDELIGENIHILVGGGEAEAHDAYLAAFDRGGRDSSNIGNHRVLYAKRKDGNEFPCTIGIRRSEDSDSLVGYIRNMSGITAEDMALKEKTKYLVDDNSFDSIIVTDDEGTILQVNATTVEEFGYNAKAELVGKNLTLLVGGGRAKHHAKYMKNFKKKKKEDSTIGKQRKLKARRRNGSEFTCVIGIRRVEDTDWLIGYIRSTEGLSRLEEYENMSQKSAGSVSTFGSNASGSGYSNSIDSNDGSDANGGSNSRVAKVPEDQELILDDKCGVQR